MTDVTITTALVQEIAALANLHLKALNEAVTERWPDAPDMHLTLAIGWYVSVMLGNLSDPSNRQSAVDGINAPVRHTGYALSPIM